MPNSASQEAEIIAPVKPADIEDYETFWRKNNSYGTLSNSDQAMVRFLNFFTGEGNRVKNLYNAYVDNWKQNYQNYLNDLNIYNEQKAVQSARAWDEYMSSSQYSRTFDDLKKAGINPYMLISSGSVSPASYSSTAKADYSKYGVNSKSSLAQSESKTNGRDFAIVLLAIARLIAAL